VNKPPIKPGNFVTSWVVSNLKHSGTQGLGSIFLHRNSKGLCYQLSFGVFEVDADAKWGRFVVGSAKRQSLIHAPKLDPTLNHPARVGSRYADVRNRVLFKGRDRDALPTFAHAPDDSVHERCNPLVFKPFRQLDIFVPNNRCRVLEENQLVGCHAQDVASKNGKFVQRVIAEMLDDVVKVKSHFHDSHRQHCNHCPFLRWEPLLPHQFPQGQVDIGILFLYLNQSQQRQFSGRANLVSRCRVHHPVSHNRSPPKSGHQKRKRFQSSRVLSLLLLSLFAARLSWLRWLLSLSS
jgi:hypothetical protein